MLTQPGFLGVGAAASQDIAQSDVLTLQQGAWSTLRSRTYPKGKYTSRAVSVRRHAQ
jgi:hypothetical protein